MKRMPLSVELNCGALTASAQASETATPNFPDWRELLPVLTGRLVTLRELRVSDAPSLLTMLSTQEVARFISPAPATLDGFVRFIEWAQQERARGHYVCFAVVPHGLSTAVGLFQIRQLEQSFATAEWGFAIGSAYWGTGMFVDGGKLAADFAFETLGVHRLEARAAVVNGRGNGALRKLGAVQEGVLRRSFLCNGQYIDQMLWSILDTDWRETKTVSQVLVH